MNDGTYAQNGIDLHDWSIVLRDFVMEAPCVSIKELLEVTYRHSQ